MRGRRERILQAAGEAARILDKFPLGRRTGFDIIRAVTALGVPIMFRPTKDLLGATIAVGEDVRGVLVTTKRSLAIQRFTLAHELGHIRLGHNMRFHLFDDEEDRPVSEQADPLEEDTAEEFASGVLAARQNISRIATAQDWNSSQIQNPTTIYQLSLRLGISFKATCWALARCKMLSAELAKRIALGTEVSKLKKALVSPYSLPDLRADVWRLAEADGGTLLECGPNDVFAVIVRDSASGGFLWELAESSQAFEVVHERTDITTIYGADSSRLLLLRCKTPGRHSLSIEHKRPWSGERLSELEISIANFGKETEGLPRSVKQEILLTRPRQ